MVKFKGKIKFLKLLPLKVLHTIYFAKGKDLISQFCLFSISINIGFNLNSTKVSPILYFAGNSINSSTDSTYMIKNGSHS